MCADQGVQGLKNAGHRADVDANIVTAHKRAGFVMTGRTNTPEIGLAATTDDRLRDARPVRSPVSTA